MSATALVVTGGFINFVIKFTREALASHLELRVVIFFVRVWWAFRLVCVRLVYV